MEPQRLLNSDHLHIACRLFPAMPSKNENINSTVPVTAANKEIVDYDAPSSPEPSCLHLPDSDASKAVRRKVDHRLLAFYCVVYLFMRINATNVTNTAIMNAGEPTNIKIQLGNLSSSQWAWIISIFSYPYMFFEPPSTLLLKRFTPRVWMSRIMITWGAISMCQAATTSSAGMLACRFFLGAAEAGYYPGVLYHLSFWYPAGKLPLRIAVFYSFGVFSGTASGFLAYAISFANGRHGISGWQWMFILEGIPAVCLGIIAWFWLPNWPETAKFLNAEAKETLLSDLPSTQPSGTAKTWNVSQARELVTDPTFVSFNLLWIFHSIGGWGISLVLPTVIYELGLEGSAISQLMTMPTYTFGCTFMCFFGWLIHRGLLGPWTVSMGLEVVIVVCYIILLTVNIPAVKYVFVTLATACVACIYPLMWPERIRAARGTTGAGFGIGITNVRILPFSIPFSRSG
jgi:MFS family permease